MEREWLGHETIAELERCYLFIDRTTGGKLPRRVLITVTWMESKSRVDTKGGSITVGMNTPAAATDGRTYLLHAAIREMARLALLELSKGAAARDDASFILEGMAEFLTHEYDRSSRSLGAAWAHCHLLDRTRPLSFASLASWDVFSQGRQDLRAASPGITFLMTCREAHGRDRLFKLLEALRDRSLHESLSEAFRAPAAKLESAWLERVRAYRLPESLTVGSDNDAPQLDRVEFDPPAGSPGDSIRARVLLRDRNSDLSPAGVYFEDLAAGKVIQSQPVAEAGAKAVLFELPIEKQRAPGEFGYRLIAIDEAGNLRIWTGSYRVALKQAGNR